MEAIVLVLQTRVSCSHFGFRIAGTGNVYLGISCLLILIGCVTNSMHQLSSFFSYHQCFAIAGELSKIAKWVCLACAFKPKCVLVVWNRDNDMIKLVIRKIRGDLRSIPAS